MRLSYVGELGWELYTTADQGLVLWDLLMSAGAEHGIIAAGRGAFNALRIEKGYRSFGGDMTNEHTPAQAGLDFAVKLDQDFLGKDALLARPDDGRRLCLLAIDGPNDIVLGSEPVYALTSPVARINSAGADQLRPNVTSGAEVNELSRAELVDPREAAGAVGYVTSAAYALHTRRAAGLRLAAGRAHQPRHGRGDRLLRRALPRRRHRRTRVRPRDEEDPVLTSKACELGTPAHLTTVDIGCGRWAPVTAARAANAVTAGAHLREMLR